jgi:pilus assembly protein CpaB
VGIRSVLVLTLALAFGGSAAVGINAFLKQSRAAAAPPVDTVPVVVTAEDVPRFAPLSADLLAIRDFPKELVPPGSIRTLEEAADRVTLVSLGKGEPVVNERISAKGAGRGMGAVIPKGMRAFTINTPNVAANVTGFILPGSKVDVLLTVKTNNPGDGTGGTITSTILQNMEILAVDQHVEATSSGKVDSKDLRSVTLLVTPQQAAKLDLGQNAGVIHLTLRNPEDKAEASIQASTLSELNVGRLVQAPAPIKAPERKEPVVVGGSAWSGRQDLPGIETVSFHFYPGGKAQMNDGRGSHAGTWVQAGNHVTVELQNPAQIRTLHGTQAGEINLQFAGTRYHGTIDDKGMSGQAQEGERTWEFNVTHLGTTSLAAATPH